MSGLHAPQAHHSRVRGTMASLHHGPSVSLRSTRPAAPGAARATVRSCHGRSQLQRARAVSCRAASELEQLQGVRVVKASSPNEEVELLSLWQVGIFPATRQAHHHMPMKAVRRTAGMHAYYSTAHTFFRPRVCIGLSGCVRASVVHTTAHLESFSSASVTDRKQVGFNDRPLLTC